MGGDLLPLAGQFGPMGLMVGYLVWRETRDYKLREADIAERGKLAVALALLTEIVRAKHNV